MQELQSAGLSVAPPEAGSVEAALTPGTSVEAETLEDIEPLSSSLAWWQYHGDVPEPVQVKHTQKGTTGGHQPTVKQLDPGSSP